MNDILQSQKCGRNTHVTSCLSSDNLLHSFSLSYRSPPCHCDTINRLSYLFVHSFFAQCGLVKGYAGQQGQKLLLCFVLNFAPFEREERLCFLRVSLKALQENLWQVQGGAGREPAAGVWTSEKAEHADTEVTERDSESQREFAAIHSESCWTESKVRKKEGQSG